jgi:hypothetical protein
LVSFSKEKATNFDDNQYFDIGQGDLFLSVQGADLFQLKKVKKDATVFK